MAKKPKQTEPQPPGLFSFMKTSMPDKPAGAYQSGGTTLKVFGWVALVLGALTVLFMFFGFLIAGFFGAAFGSAADSWGWGDEFGAFAGFFLVMMLIGIIFVVGFWVGVLYWGSWTYQRWTEFNPAALTSMMVLGIVLTILGGFGVLSMLAFAGIAFYDFSGDRFDFTGIGTGPFTSIAQLAFGILFIVFASNPENRETFGKA